jgi:hypothetical protein
MEDSGIFKKLAVISSGVFLIVLGACGGDTDYEPLVLTDSLFQLSKCNFDDSIHAKVTCGYLHVPENRRVDGSRSISLHVAIFHSESSNPEPDPIIYLAGGPGSQALRLSGSQALRL